MGELGYQDLLSKCIEDGLPGGGYPMSSSRLEVKSDSAAGKGRFLGNSTNGSREGTSGVSAGSLQEIDVSSSDGTRTDATGLKTPNSQVTTPKSVTAGGLVGKALQTEEFLIDEVPLSPSKSMSTSGIVFPAAFPSHTMESCNTRRDSAPPMFSFRSLLEGAIITSGIRSCTTSRSVPGPDKQGVSPYVEPQNSAFLAENCHPDQSALFGDRNDDLCKLNSTRQSHRGQRFLQGKGAPESLAVQRNTPRTHGCGSSTEDTVGDKVPPASYASLLQAQLGGSYSQKILHRNVEDVEPHSLLLNLRLKSSEVKDGFLSLLTQTTPLLSSASIKVQFPPPAPNSIDKKTSDVGLFEDFSRDHTEQDSQSPDNVPESDTRKTSARPASPLLTRLEENDSQTEVFGPVSSLVTNSTCNDKGVSDPQLRKQPTDAFAVYESPFISTTLEGSATCTSEAALVQVSSVQTPTVVLDRESFLLADSPCTDERMSELELLEELSQALASHESQFAENVLNGNALDSSSGAVDPALPATRGEDDGSRTEVVMPNSVPIHRRILNVQLSKKASGKFCVDELQLAENFLNIESTGSSGTAVLSTSTLTGIDEDVPARRIAVDKETELCGDPALHLKIYKKNALNLIPMLNSPSSANPPCKPVYDYRSRASPGSQIISDLCAECQIDSIRLETTLKSSCQVVVNQLGDALGDSKEELRDNMYHDQAKCGTDGASEAIVIEPFDIANCRAFMTGKTPVQESVVKEPGDTSNDERLCSRQDKAFSLNSNVAEENISLLLPVVGESSNQEQCFIPGHLKSPPFLDKRKTNRTESRAAVGCSLEADLKQTENGKGLFEEQKSKTCDGQTSSARNLLLRPDTDINFQDAVLEEEAGISKCEAVHDVKNDLNMDDLAVKSSSLMPLDGHVVIGESHPAPARKETIIACVAGGFEPLNAGDVGGPSWEAGPEYMKDTKGTVLIEQEVDLCDVQMVDNFMDQDDEAAEQCLKDKDSRGGPRKSCVGNAEVPSTGASLHVIGNLLVEDRNHSNEGNGTDSLIEVVQFNFADEKAEHENKPRGLESFSEVENHPVIEQHIVNIRTVEMPETQLAIPPCSECQVIKQGDQLLSMDPDAISEGLRQVFVRDRDATLSDSPESVEVSEAGLGAAQETGREVQSLLERKFKERRLDDLGDRDSIHCKGHIRHLDALEENGKQPGSSQLIGAIHDQLATTEVRDQKKKSRPRVYNHEKSLQGKGNSHCHVSGVNRKRHLQTQKENGNRCRRNRHIDPDQRVPVFIEGRDEGFEETNGGAFLRWLSYQDEGNDSPSSAGGKRPRKNSREMEKHLIAIPSFRVVAEYEDIQREVDKRRKILARSHTVRPSDYDMDDEDERWLHAWNKQLTSAGLKEPISEDKFEEIIEYFERRAAQLNVVPAADVLGHSEPVVSLLTITPSDINQATLDITVPEKEPVLNPSTIRSGHTPWSAGEGAVASSSIQVDSVEREPASQASTVRHHLLASKNEESTCKFVVDAVGERPKELSVQKAFSPPLLNSSVDCCICNRGKFEENEPKKTCKQCFVHVHQSSSGTRGKILDDQRRVIAPGYWYYRKFEEMADGRIQSNVSCSFCSKKGGALKRTVATQKWAHIACALYTNDTLFDEAFDGIAAVTERTQEQDQCGLCGTNEGICSRAPFQSSFKASQGASTEGAPGVLSICPRHARTTSIYQDNLMLSCSISSEATPSGAVSGSISTASSTDCRQEGRSLQCISHQNVSFEQPLWRSKNSSPEVADFTENVMSVNGKCVEDVCRLRGVPFILKRMRDETCTQVSEDGLSFDLQEKSNRTRDFEDKIEAQTCKSTSHVVEYEQRPKEINFEVAGLDHNQHSESLPTIVHLEISGSEDLQLEKNKMLLPVVNQLANDAAIGDKSSQILRSLTEDRFNKEVIELVILEEARNSGVAPPHVMREAFVYWRAKRAEHDGSLLREFHHEHWSKSQGIFNKDASVEENVAREKLGSPSIFSPAQQQFPMSSEKILEKTKELRKQLGRLRTMSQMVVQREKLKYNRQLVLGTIALVEQNKADNASKLRYCVWCPSTKKLLNCKTCPRSFCFNCFKHRKGFGVKGWMAAMKQPLYRCNYCRELSAKITDLSIDLNFAPKKSLGGGLVSTSAIVGKPGGGDRRKGIRKGRGNGRNWRERDYLIPAPFSLDEGGAMDLQNKTIYVNKERNMAQGISSGEDKSCARGQNLDVNQNVTMSVDNPSKNVVANSADARDSSSVFRVESDAPSVGNVGNNTSPASPNAMPSPALLVYKTKKKFLLGTTSESPSAYDFPTLSSPLSLEQINCEDNTTSRS